MGWVEITPAVNSAGEVSNVRRAGEDENSPERMVVGVRFLFVGKNFLPVDAIFFFF